MQPIEDVAHGSSLPIGAIRETLADTPVEFAVCFGSVARGETHAHSDLDIAIALDPDPGTPGYNDAFFGASAALATLLGTDDVDVVDIASVSGPLAQAIHDDGLVIYGDPDRAARRLHDQFEDAPDPRERFDDALRRIDEHLA